MTERTPTIEEDIATCIANLKGPRDKKLMDAARALNRLRSHREFRTNPAVAKLVGVSAEIVREFLVLLNFPEDIQHRFDAGTLGLEQGRRLWQYARSIRTDDEIEWGRVHRVADVMETMTALDSRELVKYLRHHPDTHPEEVKSRILGSATEIRPRFHVVAELTQDDYGQLREEAQERSASLDGLITEVVIQWLQKRRAERSNG